MTRWARRGNSVIQNRKVCAATPWEELNKEGSSETLKRKTHGEGNAHQGYSKKRKKKDVYVNQDVNGFRDHQENEEIDLLLTKDQRREGRRLKRQSTKRDSMVCFHCRKPGHGMADCAEALRCQEMGTGICFRCGSTEHEVAKCRAKVDPALGEFPYAKCFICGEMGHLSRSCPDNPKGLYAEGGSCRLCGSVEHFQRDCPEKQNSAQLTVGRWSSGMSADYEEIPVDQKVRKAAPKGQKIVTF
ncbi:zinc finger CCHC domain-containing protein 9 [Bombina bombina]|uniref:zinc finger CCHC domain-containing protein 9 n=1 Tax=Bombina bombina TaxID=8345 RepID=UPI00235A6596|nr:zinc finger CCHC domain-containing protein 9 [Bombina bombina]